MIRTSIAVLFALALSAFAEHPILPFPVTVGGQEAKAKSPTSIYAELEKEVAADAEVELKLEKPTMIFINVFPCDAKGATIPGGKTTVIVAQNTTKAKLDATIDKSTLKPGLYISNIVAAGKTSRVMFKVKEAKE